MNYYKSELNKLGNLKLNSSIQIKCKGKKTNYIAINKESKKELINFIKNI
jgi:hypothetical protein